MVLEKHWAIDFDYSFKTFNKIRCICFTFHLFFPSDDRPGLFWRFTWEPATWDAGRMRRGGDTQRARGDPRALQKYIGFQFKLILFFFGSIMCTSFGFLSGSVLYQTLLSTGTLLLSLNLTISLTLQIFTSHWTNKLLLDLKIQSGSPLLPFISSNWIAPHQIRWFARPQCRRVDPLHVRSQPDHKM